MPSAVADERLEVAELVAAARSYAELLAFLGHDADSRDLEGAANVVAERLALRPAFYVDDGKVQIDGEAPIVLGDSQAVVLEAVLAAGGACSLEEMQERSGLPWAADRFRKLAEHPRIGHYFRRPLRKGNSGYSTTIRDGRVSCAQ